MGVLDQGAKHGTLMQLTLSADGGMGQEPTWAAVGAVRMRLTTASSKTRRAYERHGFENLVTVQAIDAMPVRLLGHKTLSDLLLAFNPPTKRLRINYEGRTLSIVGARVPNDGQVHGTQSVVNIDCVETPQAVGVLDKT